MAQEQWKAVEGYEGLYEVSSLGQVRSKARHGTKGGILKPYADKDGYYFVNLYKDKKKTLYFLHRLVARTFIQNDNQGFKLIDHINRVRTDNRVSNLRWVDNRLNGINRNINKNNTSGKTGVHFNNKDGKWRATIKSFQKTIYGGYFDNLEDAIAKRKELEKQYFGE